MKDKGWGLPQEGVKNGDPQLSPAWFPEDRLTSGREGHTGQEAGTGGYDLA